MQHTIESNPQEEEKEQQPPTTIKQFWKHTRRRKKELSEPCVKTTTQSLLYKSFLLLWKNQLSSGLSTRIKSKTKTCVKIRVDSVLVSVCSLRSTVTVTLCAYYYYIFKKRISSKFFAVCSNKKKAKEIESLYLRVLSYIVWSFNWNTFRLCLTLERAVYCLFDQIIMYLALGSIVVDPLHQAPFKIRPFPKPEHLPFSKNTSDFLNGSGICCWMRSYFHAFPKMATFVTKMPNWGL